MAPDYDFAEEGFDNVILKDEKNFISLKTNVMNEEDAERWKDVYCEKFNVSLNSQYYYDVVRFSLHRRYVCTNGVKSHKGKKRTFTGCPVIMNIKIKLITKATLKKDKSLQDFPCFITIRGEHNHSTESALALQQMRVLPDIKEQFFRYFESGMNASRARKHHEEKISNDPSLVGNNAVNPTLRSIYYLYDVWIKTNHADKDIRQFKRKYVKKKHLNTLDSSANGEDKSKPSKKKNTKKKPNDTPDPVDDGAACDSGADNADDNDCESEGVVHPSVIEPEVNVVCQSDEGIRDKEVNVAQRPPVDLLSELECVLRMVVSNYGDSNTPRAVASVIEKLKTVRSSYQLNSWLFSFGAMYPTGNNSLPDYPYYNVYPTGNNSFPDCAYYNMSS